jgi:hypothetical protein
VVHLARLTRVYDQCRPGAQPIRHKVLVHCSNNKKRADCHVVFVGVAIAKDLHKNAQNIGVIALYRSLANIVPLRAIICGEIPKITQRFPGVSPTKLADPSGSIFSKPMVHQKY